MSNEVTKMDTILARVRVLQENLRHANYIGRTANEVLLGSRPCEDCVVSESKEPCGTLEEILYLIDNVINISDSLACNQQMILTEILPSGKYQEIHDSFNKKLKGDTNVRVNIR